MSDPQRPVDCSLPGFSVHGIFQARVLEWVAIAFSSICSAKSLQSCPTQCDPIGGSLPGSSVHGIFQARVLEQGAIAFSKMVNTKIKLIIFFAAKDGEVLYS